MQGLRRREWLRETARAILAGSAVRMIAGGAALPLLGGDALAETLRQPGALVQPLVAAPSTSGVWPGRTTSLLTFGGSYPSPTLRARRGELLELQFENRLTEATNIHWHGLAVPPEADGHPTGVLPPGGTRHYRFRIAERAGTLILETEKLMKRNTLATALVFGLAFLTVGCGAGGDDSMMGPSRAGSSQPGASFMSVTPQGGMMGVPGSTAMVFRFGAAMGYGMEQYVDLHKGDLAGPTTHMNCLWSTDRTILTCTPRSPLSPRTTYVMHLGGGLMTQAGQALDYSQHGPMMGGQWITGGMMSNSHAGAAWAMMGANWHHTNGSHGMAFSFTTD